MNQKVIRKTNSLPAINEKLKSVNSFKKINNYNRRIKESISQNNYIYPSQLELPSITNKKITINFNNKPNNSYIYPKKIKLNNQNNRYLHLNSSVANLKNNKYLRIRKKITKNINRKIVPQKNSEQKTELFDVIKNNNYELKKISRNQFESELLDNAENRLSLNKKISLNDIMDNLIKIQSQQDLIHDQVQNSLLEISKEVKYDKNSNKYIYDTLNELKNELRKDDKKNKFMDKLIMGEIKRIKKMKSNVIQKCDNIKITYVNNNCEESNYNKYVNYEKNFIENNNIDKFNEDNTEIKRNNCEFKEKNEYPDYLILNKYNFRINQNVNYSYENNLNSNLDLF